ncbi:MAG: sigma-70 family RNA polymerase sigma factor [Firmicutes bacterium]|nr:sigma-70 family RNA polymerase sigma factor [Bacillota bacterium]
MKDRSLNELVSQAKQGDPRAKEEIIDRFHPLLLKHINRYFRKDPDMEDLLQEGRYIVLKAIHDFDFEMGVPFPAYVQRCTFYYYVDQRKKRRELVILDKPLKEGTCLRDLMVYEQAAPDEDVIRIEEVGDLHRAIGTLSPKQRKVIVGYYFHQKSLNTLAKEEGLSYQSMVKRKARAMAKLREKICMD